MLRAQAAASHWHSQATSLSAAAQSAQVVRRDAPLCVGSPCSVYCLVCELVAHQCVLTLAQSCIVRYYPVIPLGQQVTAAGGASSAHAAASSAPLTSLEDKITAALAALPALPPTSSAVTPPLAARVAVADLVHRIAATDALLDAAKATLQQRTCQVAALVDTVNVLHAALQARESSCECGDGRDDCDCSCQSDGSDRSSELSRRVVELTRQVLDLAQRGPLWHQTAPTAGAPSHVAEATTLDQRDDSVGSTPRLPFDPPRDALQRERLLRCAVALKRRTKERDEARAALAGFKVR